MRSTLRFHPLYLLLLLPLPALLLWPSPNLFLRIRLGSRSVLPIYPLRRVLPLLARLLMAQSSCSFVRCQMLLPFPYGEPTSCSP